MRPLQSSSSNFSQRISLEINQNISNVSVGLFFKNLHLSYNSLKSSGRASANPHGSSHICEYECSEMYMASLERWVEYNQNS